MLILLDQGCSTAERNAILERIQGANCRATATPSPHGEILVVSGDLDHLRREPIELLPGVGRLVSLSKPYTLSGREHQAEPTIVDVGGVKIGDGGFTVMGGPCAVETRELLLETALAVKAAGAQMLRGGAYKPRTSPYAFRGLGTEGLMLLREVGHEVGLPTVSEVTDPRHVEACMTNVDMLQIGTRNMSNFELLVEVGRSGHPVLLKRGRSATIKDWLLAAEYILAQGNSQVVLCERGVRGFDSATRNLLDLAAVAVVKERSHLPVIVDPSHATGHARYVPAMSRAACAAGADGVLIEVHAQPEKARCDADQALRPAQFHDLCDDLRLISQVVHRNVGHGG
jgi:3-deoxy-7-phosphoheptulonate synthase